MVLTVLSVPTSLPGLGTFPVQTLRGLVNCSPAFLLQQAKLALNTGEWLTMNCGERNAKGLANIVA